MASTSAAARAPKENFKVGDRVFYKEDGATYTGTVVDVRTEAAYKVTFEIIGASTPTYPKGSTRTQRGDITPFVSINPRELIENSVHKVYLIGFYGPEHQTIKITKMIPHVESDKSVEYSVRLDNPNTYPDAFALSGPDTGYKYVLARDNKLTSIADEYGNAMTASTAEAATSSTSAAASAPHAKYNVDDRVYYIHKKPERGIKGLLLSY